MAVFNKIRQFVEDIANHVHDFDSDQLVVALCAAANAPVNTNETLSDLTQASYTNCSSRNVTTTSSVQTAGVLKVTLADLTLTAGGGPVGPFRYVVLYNDTPTSPADPLICWYDYGSDITLADGESLLINFDDAGGAFTIT